MRDVPYCKIILLIFTLGILSGTADAMAQRSSGSQSASTAKGRTTAELIRDLQEARAELAGLREQVSALSASIVQIGAQHDTLAKQVQRLDGIRTDLDDRVKEKIGLTVAGIYSNVERSHAGFIGTVLTIVGLALVLVLTGSNSMLKRIEDRLDERVDWKTSEKAEAMKGDIQTWENGYQTKLKELLEERKNAILSEAKLRIYAGSFTLLGKAFWDQYVAVATEIRKSSSPDILSTHPTYLEGLQGEKKRNLETAIRLSDYALQNLGKMLIHDDPEFESLLTGTKNNLAYYLVEQADSSNKDRALSLVAEVILVGYRYRELEKGSSPAPDRIHFWPNWLETCCRVRCKWGNNIEQRTARDLMATLCQDDSVPTGWTAEKWKGWRDEKRMLYAL